jgi:hypothetical protein
MSKYPTGVDEGFLVYHMVQTNTVRVEMWWRVNGDVWTRSVDLDQARASQLIANLAATASSLEPT